MDVARAFLARWRQSAALDALVPGGCHSDRLPENQPLPDGADRPTPYARLTVEPGKEPDYSSGGDYIDYRKVTVEIYGVGKEAMGEVVSAVRGVFDSPAPLDFSAAPKVKGHMRTQPLGDSEAEDETRRQGEDVRKAVVPFMVWTHRSAG